ncbi:MAG: hypothetical protein ACREM3_29255 [Candidatus Rokuibacteriota bacterium]
MRGNAALAVWFRVDAAGVPDLDAWYPRQHLPERLSVPGFLRGRRYAAASARLPYFTLYETEDAAVLSSAPYLERLNAPTDWTRRVLPTFRLMVRNAYRRLGGGGDDRFERHLLTVQVKPDSGRGPYVREWLEGQAAASLGALAGVAGAAGYVSDTGGTTVVTEERKIVGGEVVGGAPFLALVEVTDPGAEPALREFWEGWARKMAAEATVDFYQLMYGLSWL